MKKTINLLSEKPVLPLIQHNGQWIVAPNTNRLTLADATVVQEKPVNTLPQISPWLGVVGGLTGVASFLYAFPKARKELRALKYKQVLEAGDQQPLNVLQAATQRSEKLKDQIINLDNPEVQTESAKVNAAINAMFLEGKLGTSQGQRTLAGKGYRAEKLDVEGLQLKTDFGLRNQLKGLFLAWWARDNASIYNRLTQQRLTQPSQTRRWWFELFNPASKKAHLRGMSFDGSRLHNNQFQVANLSETTYRNAREYQNNYNRADLTKSVKDGIISYFNDYSDAKVEGMSAENAQFLGLTANRLDARPAQDLKDPSIKTPTSFKGVKILKQGNLQEPVMPVQALSNMKHANLTSSDWQGAIVEGLNLTGSKMDKANLQDSIWMGTVHDKQDFRKTRLYTGKNRFIKFEPSKLPPFRNPESSKKSKEFCTFERANLAYKNMSGVAIDGVRFKNANIAYTYLAKSTINGITVHDIVKNPAIYNNEMVTLKNIILGYKAIDGQPPILTNDSFMRPNNVQNASTLTSAEKLKLAQQLTARLRQSIVNNVLQVGESV